MAKPMILEQNLLRNRLHRLIALMDESDLPGGWEFLETFHYDASMLRAIQEAKTTLKPGDTLTIEEALQVLYFYDASEGS